MVELACGEIGSPSGECEEQSPGHRDLPAFARIGLRLADRDDATTEVEIAPA